MKKRVFVGFGVSDSLQKKIFSLQKKYKSLPVRWIDRKNLHITLIPPWYTSDTNSVVLLLKKVRGMKGMTIVFEKVGFGPIRNRPRLIWAESLAPNEILNLKTKIQKVLKKPGEKRKFTLHLTLARFRPENFTIFPIKQLCEKVSWRQTLNSFCLYEAHLKRSGAEYKKLMEFKF